MRSVCVSKPGTASSWPQAHAHCERRRRRCRVAVPHEQWVEMTGSLSHKKSSLPSPHQLHGHLILFSSILKRQITRSFFRVCDESVCSVGISKMARAWSTVIGLEIHAQLLTTSKLFARYLRSKASFCLFHRCFAGPARCMLPLGHWRLQTPPSLCSIAQPLELSP